MHAIYDYTRPLGIVCMPYMKVYIEYVVILI
jgi:hypothetical protein